LLYKLYKEVEEALENEIMNFVLQKPDFSFQNK